MPFLGKNYYICKNKRHYEGQETETIQNDII